MHLLPVSNDIGVEAAGEAVDVIFVDVQVRRIAVSVSRAENLLSYAPACDLLDRYAIAQHLEDTHVANRPSVPGRTINRG